MAANAEKEKLQLQRLVLEHVLRRMAKVRDDYNVQLQELYFLQTGGNMMDFLGWKQRPNKNLEEFMAQNRLDEDDLPTLPSCGGATAEQSARKREGNAEEDLNAPGPSHGDKLATGAVSAGLQAGDGMQKGQPVTNVPSSQEQIAMQAKQEARVLKRVSELTMEGLWSAKRLPKVHEPVRKKTHWDYLLEEMVWLSSDFAQERRWKKTAARKLATSVAKQHAQRLQKEQRAERDEVIKLKRVASFVAKEIRQFWTNIEKIVQYKQEHRLAEKRQKALDMHLNFIVGQTEKYSSWLMESMAEPAGNTVKGSGSELDDSDLSSESDDEATIEKEEEAEPSEVSNLCIVITKFVNVFILNIYFVY
jgi:E1A-binding protein p400